MGSCFQMRASVSEDGMWYENSWGYHFYTLGAMVKIVEGARRLGIDLWRDPVLKRMFIVPVEYAMPDGSLPRFGDDVQTTVSQASRMLEFAYHAYRDPAMLPFLPRQPSWESVMLGRAVTPPPPARPTGQQALPQRRSRDPPHRGRKRPGCGIHLRPLRRVPRTSRQAQLRPLRLRPRVGR